MVLNRFPKERFCRSCGRGLSYWITTVGRHRFVRSHTMLVGLKTSSPRFFYRITPKSIVIFRVRTNWGFSTNGRLEAQGSWTQSIAGLILKLVGGIEKELGIRLKHIDVGGGVGITDFILKSLIRWLLSIRLLSKQKFESECSTLSVLATNYIVLSSFLSKSIVSGNF